MLFCILDVIFSVKEIFLLANFFKIVVQMGSALELGHF